MEKDKKEDNDDRLHPSLEEVYLGVWRIVYSRGARFTIPGRNSIEHLAKAYTYTQTYLVPFFRDVWIILGPRLFGLFIINQIWWGMEGAVLLYLLNGLLKEVRYSSFSLVYTTTHSIYRLKFRITTAAQMNGVSVEYLQFACSLSVL